MSNAYHIPLIMLIAFVATAISELASWYFVYRKEDYGRIVRQLTRLTEKGEKNERKAEKLEKEKQVLQAQLAPFQLRTGIVNLATIIIGYQFLNNWYAGLVIVTLPFPMLFLLRPLTHRTLEGDNYAEMSAHFFFAFGIVYARKYISAFMEKRGLKPKNPPQLSFYEMAAKEVEKAEKAAEKQKKGN